MEQNETWSNYRDMAGRYWMSHQYRLGCYFWWEGQTNPPWWWCLWIVVLVSTVLFRIILTVVIPWGESFLFLPKSLNSEKAVNSFPVHELLTLSLFTFTVTHFIFGPTCIEFLFIFYIGYILKFNWQVHPPYTINISLTQELKLCHCIIVEPASHFKLLPTSILDIYKVFDHIDIMSIGKQYQPNADTPTLLGSDLVVPGSFVDPKWCHYN